jgi:Zn-dependent peptidase ImmA (M78 family)
LEEVQANQFAAELLIPREAVLKESASTPEVRTDAERLDEELET